MLYFTVRSVKIFFIGILNRKLIERQSWVHDSKLSHKNINSINPRRIISFRVDRETLKGLVGQGRSCIFVGHHSEHFFNPSKASNQTIVGNFISRFVCELRLNYAEQNVTVNHLCNVLRGSRCQKIIDLEQDSLAHYGSLNKFTNAEITAFISAMLRNEMLLQYFVDNNSLPNAYIKLVNTIQQQMINFDEDEKREENEDSDPNSAQFLLELEQLSIPTAQANRIAKLMPREYGVVMEILGGGSSNETAKEVLQLSLKYVTQKLMAKLKLTAPKRKSSQPLGSANKVAKIGDGHDT